MANESKTTYLSRITSEVNNIVNHTDPMTDAEAVAVFNAALEVAKTVSPTKGGVKAIYQV